MTDQNEISGDSAATPDLPSAGGLGRRLTHGYLLAIVLIAATLLGAYLVVSDLMARSHDGTARTVLIERMTLLASGVVDLAEFAAQGNPHATEALADNLNDLAGLHGRLLHGDAASGVTPLPGGFRAVYLDGESGIDKALTRLFETARLAVLAPAPQTRLTAVAALGFVQENQLAPALSRAELGFASSAARNLDAARGVQKVSLLALLAVLIGVFFLIVLPTVRRTRRHVAALERLALSDPLTGLANRRAFHAEAERELARMRRGHATCAVLMVDIDHFKKINDRHGHDAGDAALCRFAAVARQTLRADDLAARIGGEEFAVLLCDVDAEAALAVAQKLRLALAGDQAPDSAAFTVSIGVAAATLASTVNGLLVEADSALYRAKAGGRNRACAARSQPEPMPQPVHKLRSLRFPGRRPGKRKVLRLTDACC